MKKHYRGRALHLAYPGFLKIESYEPEWTAAEPRTANSAMVLIDPPGDSADAFGRTVRNPHYARSSAVHIDREGPISTARGIEGHERLARLSIEHRVSWVWWIDAKFRNHRVLNIQIGADDSRWGDGSIWQALVDSIEVITASDNAESLLSKAANPKKHPPALRRLERVGVLTEFPGDLQHLLELALLLGSIPKDEIEDNAAVWAIIESSLKERMSGLTNEKARARIIQDRERLSCWLQLHPPEKYPETECLWNLSGVLFHAPGLFKPGGPR